MLNNESQQDTAPDQQNDSNYTMVFWDTLPVISADEPELERPELEGPAAPEAEEDREWHGAEEEGVSTG